jgi:hypothetical protein
MKHETLSGSPLSDCWDQHYLEVNAWRGECMHHLSVAERAVTETLLTLDEAKPEGTKINMRHLFGQRIEDLLAATSADGVFAKQGKAAHQAIENFCLNHDGFRNLLCHGVLQVAATRNAEWLLVIRNLSISAKRGNETTACYEKCEAEEKLNLLRDQVQKLSSVLGNLRREARQGKIAD